MMQEVELAASARLGPVSQIPPGEGRSFLVRGYEVAVFRQRDGELFALGNRCPHRGGPLADGIIGGGQVLCPYHSYRFDLRSGECAQAADCAVPAYTVRDEAGEIVLLLAAAEPALAAAR